MRSKFFQYLIIPVFSALTFTSVAQSGIDTVILREAVNLLSDYVSKNSETGNEEAAANFFSGYCNEAGLNVRYLNREPGSHNFIASLYPLDIRKPNIVFINHIDVVPAGDESSWKYPPFSGTIAEDKVWGRGAYDNKGLAVVQLFSTLGFLEKSREHDLPCNVSVLCVSGEETGGTMGSARVAEAYMELINPVVMIGEGGSGMDDVGFVPEGKTFFGISVAEKGMLWLKISADIESNGHASVVGSDYANELLVKALSKLIGWKQKIQFTDEVRLMFKSIGHKIGGYKGFVMRHLHSPVFRKAIRKYAEHNHELLTLFNNTVTITNFGVSELKPNINSRVAEAYIDCRLLPGTSPEEFIDQLIAVIGDSLIKIEKLNKYQEQFTSLPDSCFYMMEQAVKTVFENSEVSPMLFPASNDNSYFRKYGCPVYGFNPMIISKQQLQAIHNKDEFIDFDDLSGGIEIFTSFIDLMMKGASTGEMK